jgi:hypothetical protein
MLEKKSAISNKITRGMVTSIVISDHGYKRRYITGQNKKKS